MKLRLTSYDKDKYIEFLIRQFRLVDALWFLNVEREFGLDAATKINEMVWAEMGSRAARDIKKRFNIDVKGLKGFIEAFKYFPWIQIIDYRYSFEDNKLIIKVVSCPPQEARVKHGLPVFPCKSMHQKEFEGFAKEIDENITVKCIYAPPDQRKDKYWCIWEFTLKT